MERKITNGLEIELICIITEKSNFDLTGGLTWAAYN